MISALPKVGFGASPRTSCPTKMSINAPINPSAIPEAFSLVTCSFKIMIESKRVVMGVVVTISALLMGVES